MARNETSTCKCAKPHKAKTCKQSENLSPQHRLTVRDHQSITQTLALADRLLAESKICKCVDCNAQRPSLRIKAEALAAVVVRALQLGGEVGSPQYLAARKTQLEATPPEPELPWVAAGGFAMQGTRVVYTKCVRTERNPRSQLT